jgi:hypothetical protein
VVLNLEHVSTDCRVAESLVKAVIEANLSPFASGIRFARVSLDQAFILTHKEVIFLEMLLVGRLLFVNWLNPPIFWTNSLVDLMH